MLHVFTIKNKIYTEKDRNKTVEKERSRQAVLKRVGKGESLTNTRRKMGLGGRGEKKFSSFLSSLRRNAGVNGKDVKKDILKMSGRAKKASMKVAPQIRNKNLSFV